jgi:uncharacterized protein (DUF58 family)
MMFLLDASASMAWGTRKQSKREVVAEIVALLALCAVNNNDKVGLAICTREIEKYVPPRKTSRHALRLIRDVFVHRPAHAGTGLRVGLDFLNRILRRRALVFVLSDFLDGDFARVLQRTGFRHDVVAVVVRDPGEEEMPAVGLLHMQDAETGAQRLVDTADAEFRMAFARQRQERRSAFQTLTRAGRIDVLEVSTAGQHLEDLLRFFRRRARRLPHQP